MFLKTENKNKILSLRKSFVRDVNKIMKEEKLIENDTILREKLRNKLKNGVL